MTAGQGPIARRYWFVDSAGLAAVRAAEDAPEWEAYPLALSAFCLDDESHEALQALAEEDATLRVVDARDAASFGQAFAAALDAERARYVQLAFHMVQDFAPSMALVMAHLDEQAPLSVKTRMLTIGAFGMGEPEDEGTIAEAWWIATDEARKGLSPCDSVDMLKAQTDALISTLSGDRIKPVAGAYYLKADEQEPLKGAARDAAKWRARTAAAWAEIERLKSEKRVRAGREAALKARHERDLARQAERASREIERLHRLSGWVGKWRRRVARLSGRK